MRRIARPPRLATKTTDSMNMMGKRASGLGEAVFRGMLSVPGVYDAFHFSQLRPGARLALLADKASCRYLVPALRDELAVRPVELLISVFATVRPPRVGSKQTSTDASGRILYRCLSTSALGARQHRSVSRDV